MDITQLLLAGMKSAVKKPNIKGYVPHSIQQDFHKSEAKGKLFFGGNRAGKTVGGGTESVDRLLGLNTYRIHKEPPVFGRGVAVNIEEGLNKIMIPEIRRWLPPSALINGSWEDSYHMKSRILTLANGSQMDFLTYEMMTEKHAGVSRDFVWFDEEPPEFIFNEDLLRLADVDGDWWMTMTPVLGMTWVYYRFYRPIKEEGKADANIEIFMVSTTDNPHVSESVLDIITAGMNESEKLARRHGQFMAATGLVYPNFHEGIHGLEPLTPEQLRGRTVVTAMDHGLRNPTCWLWATVDSEGRLVVFNEHYKSEMTITEHAAVVLDFERKWGIEPIYRVGDPAITQRSSNGGGSVQEQYADCGLYIGLGNNDVSAGINRTRTYIDKLGLYVTKNCENVLQELRGYRWDNYATRRSNETRAPRDAPKKVRDHAVDALRYLVASRPEEEFQGIAGEMYFFSGASKTVPVDYVTEADYSSTESNFHEILGDDW